MAFQKILIGLFTFVTLVCVSLLICVSVYPFFTEFFVYLPNVPFGSRSYVKKPSSVNLSYENVTFYSKDGVKLSAYFIPHENRNKVPTILFFHGNSGNIGRRNDHMKLLYDNCNSNILIFDYRGFGMSEGTPFEDGFYLDGEAAFKYLKSRIDIDRKKIVIHGNSIGGAVAVKLAAKYNSQVYALIVMNTFTSIENLIKSFSTLFEIMPHKYLLSKFPTFERIKLLDMPSFFVSSQKDKLIPPFMMRQLYEESSSPMKRLLLVKNGFHNFVWKHEGYAQHIAKFLNDTHNYYSKVNLNLTQIWEID